jgi:hypothetical protein
MGKSLSLQLRHTNQILPYEHLNTHEHNNASNAGTKQVAMGFF